MGIGAGETSGRVCQGLIDDRLGVFLDDQVLVTEAVEIDAQLKSAQRSQRGADIIVCRLLRLQIRISECLRVDEDEGPAIADRRLRGLDCHLLKHGWRAERLAVGCAKRQFVDGPREQRNLGTEIAKAVEIFFIASGNLRFDPVAEGHFQLTKGRDIFLVA